MVVGEEYIRGPMGVQGEPSLTRYLPHQILIIVEWLVIVEWLIRAELSEENFVN